MPATKKILAFDLGAESGRGLIGAFDGERLHLDVLHRFPNGAVNTLDTLHWDVLHLFGEMSDLPAEGGGRERHHRRSRRRYLGG